MRGPSCQLAQSFSMCANLNVSVPSFPLVQLKFSVYGHTYVSIHTHASCNEVPPRSPQLEENSVDQLADDDCVHLYTQNCAAWLMYMYVYKVGSHVLSHLLSY